jgi:hypothetical protein
MRRRILVTLRLVTVPWMLVALLLAAPVFASWRSSGSGHGQATTSTLAAPTGVTAPAVAYPDVAVSWTASAGTPAPTGYYVTRTGTTTVAACASSAAALIAGTSCTDAAVPVGGPYSYQVVAVYRSWTATSAASANVTVAPATKLVFTGQPTSATAGVGLSPTVAVTVETAAGAAFPAAGTSVTVSLTTPAGATLSGTTTAVTNSSGVATFSGLSVDKAASYTLTAVSSGLTSATSNSFTISAAAAASFVITSTAVSGTASAAANLGPITVQQRDAFGNSVTAGAGGRVVTLTSNSTGAAVFAATLNGTAVGTVTIASGASTATFFYGDTKAATPTITASGSLTSATQLETIVAGTATQLAFGQQPTNTARGATITPAITARLLDAFGNQATGTNSVSIAIGNNAGLLGLGVLYGTTTHNAVAGVATFSNLDVDGAVLGIGGKGTGYTLVITSTGLTAATSTPFNIT